MTVVYLIIIYVVICISMILFNIFATILEKGSNKISSKKRNIYKTKIKEQFNRISLGLNVDEEHLKYLKIKLKHSSELMILDSVVTRYKKRENKYIDEYLNLCSEVIINLIYYYEKRSNTEMSYYLSVIRDYDILNKNNSKEVEHILFNKLQDKSFYCRDNAYLAICKLANPNKICDALISISLSDKFFHQNLIFNGLSIYNGNIFKLNNLLIQNFDKFRNEIKSCIIEYLSYYDNKYNDFIYSLIDDKTDRMILLSAIKYFENIYYKKVEKLLIEYSNKYYENDLELCIACIKSLRSYPSEKSISTIIKAIHSTSFKLRNVACESLAVIRLGINAKDIEDFSLEKEENDMYNYHIRKIKKVVK